LRGVFKWEDLRVGGCEGWGVSGLESWRVGELEGVRLEGVRLEVCYGSTEYGMYCGRDEDFGNVRFGY